MIALNVLSAWSIVSHGVLFMGEREGTSKIGHVKDEIAMFEVVSDETTSKESGGPSTFVEGVLTTCLLLCLNACYPSCDCDRMIESLSLIKIVA
jgi:hypothetical protein